MSRSGRPRLLDLFCGAGGCSVGYFMAGFDVVGVDIEPHPDYPFEFVRGDAMEMLERVLAKTVRADAIHASPPCQSYSKAMKHLAHEKPMLIDAVQDDLKATGLPWVVENVVGAPLPTQSDIFGRHGVELCGTMFGLPLYRHRLFETSFPVSPPRPCDHRQPAMNPHNQQGRDRIYAEFGRQDPDPVWNEAMGVGWMGRYDGREAVPPVYTAYVGRYLRAEVRRLRPEADRDEIIGAGELQSLSGGEGVGGARELETVVGHGPVDADAVGDGESGHRTDHALPASAVNSAAECSREKAA